MDLSLKCNRPLFDKDLVRRPKAERLARAVVQPLQHLFDRSITLATPAPVAAHFARGSAFMAADDVCHLGVALSDFDEGIIWYLYSRVSWM